MKVWREDEEGLPTSKWYKIKNAKEVIEMELCSGDKLEINGIGKLEILGLYYKNIATGEHPYQSLEITCGLLTNEF